MKARRPTSASRRPSIARVPAWSDSPVKTARQRCRGVSTSATPSARPRSTSALPCSTCTSRYDSTRASCSRLWMQRLAGDAVDRLGAAHRGERLVDVEPARDRQAREARGAKARALLVDERDDRQRPARARTPDSRIAAAASSAQTTPSAPS